MFKRNKTFVPAIMECMKCHGYGWGERFQIWWKLTFASNDMIEKLEKAFTAELLAAGMIPPQGNVVVNGVFVGDWVTDFLDYLMANWDKLFAMLLQIIGLFI